MVSKEILKTENGTVTLFAFDSGQGLSEHTAPFNALAYMVDGEAQIKISGKQYNLEQGEVLIIPANEPHELKALNKFKMILVMLK